MKSSVLRSVGGSLGSTGLLTDILGPLTERLAIGPVIHWELNQTVTRARIAQVEAVSRAALAQFDGGALKIRPVHFARSHNHRD